MPPLRWLPTFPKAAEVAARTDSTRAMVLSAVLLSAFASAMLLIAPLIVGAPKS